MIRYSNKFRCAVCNGCPELPRGAGVRCAGFLSDDGSWAHCERPEHAGELRLNEHTTPPTYAHKLDGPCNCGTGHGVGVDTPHARSAPPPRRIVATYDYQDASGRVLYRVARMEPKGFLPQHINGTGTWEPGYASDTRVLYRLPALLGAPDRVAFLTEGERDADRLASLGLLSTTNAGGSSSWKKHASAYCEAFRGRSRAVVLVDNDDAGRKWAAEVAASLAGVDCPVVLIELPDLPEGGDVSDWLDAGHSVDELKVRVATAYLWKPREEVSTAVDTSDFTLTHIGDLLAEPDEATDWLVADLLPMGGLGFVGAKPKAGKSTLCRSLAVAVVRGDDFLGRRCTQGTVVYLALEEKRSEVRRHFRMLGAEANDALLIHVAKAPKDALAAMLRLIREHRPALVIIDPLLRFTRVRDEKAYAELSNALEGVMAAARESNCCIVATHHSPKAQAVDTIDALLGSTALSGAPDTVVVLRRREQERTIESVQRYGPDMERQILEMDVDTGRLSVGTTVQAAQSAAMQQRVLELLSDGAEMTTDELRDAADVRKAAVVAALGVLLERGDVTRDGSGKRGDAYRYRTPSKSVSFAVPNPTPGTAERKPETAANPLQSNDLFRSAPPDDFGLSQSTAGTASVAVERVY